MLKTKPRPAVWRYVFAVLVVGATVPLKLALASLTRGEGTFLLFFFAVLLAAWFGDRGPGLLATALAAVAADYFFLAPYYSFGLDGAEEVASLAAFLVEGALISLLVGALHSRRRQAADRATEIQGYQEHLEETEERSRWLAEEVVEGLILTARGNVFDANGTFIRMFGYGRDELAALGLLDLVSPGDREAVGEWLRSGNTEACEALALRKDGTTFPAEIRSRSIDYRGRRVQVTSVLDITGRKRAEEDLRCQRDLYEILLQAQSEVGEGFVIAEGPRISYANEAFSPTTSRSRCGWSPATRSYSPAATGVGWTRTPTSSSSTPWTAPPGCRP